MSKKSNVNPDHYKTAGREPVGQAIVQEDQKRKYKESRVRTRRRARKRRPGRIPTSK